MRRLRRRAVEPADPVADPCLNAGLSFEALVEPDFLARVRLLSLRARRAGRGGRLADQRTLARGQGSDFADYKPYVAGDDLRAIDWNAYRRLGKVFVRVFEERQELAVYLLLDVSRSLFVETPPRIEAGQRTALALGTIALAQHDAVSLFAISDGLVARVRGVTGGGGPVRLARALAACTAAGGTALAGAVAHLAAFGLRRGLAVIVSDFLDPAGLEPVLDALERLPHAVLLVQLVRAGDADPALDPDLAGDVLLDDGEGAAPAALTVDAELSDRYRDLYRAFSDRLAGFAADHRIGLVRIDADRDVPEQLAMLFAGRNGVA